MELHKYKLVAVLTLISVFVAGCGGGAPSNAGGNGVPTDTNLSFELFPANYFVNYNAAANLNGLDNKGNVYTGSIAEKTLPETIFLGENAVPIEIQIDFTISNGGFASVTQNQYFGANVSDRRYLGVDGDITTVSANPNAIPATGKIGDFGTAGTYTDNTGSISTLTWRVEDGFNGNAKLVFITTTNDALGNLDNTFSTTYLIKPDGTRLSVELKTYNVNVDLEVSLSGDY